MIIIDHRIQQMNFIPELISTCGLWDDSFTLLVAVIQTLVYGL